MARARTRPDRSLEPRVPGLMPALVVAVVLVGLFAAVALTLGNLDRARARDREAAISAAAALSAEFDRNLGVLRGADALATDGAITADEFALFARDVLPGSTFDAVALSQVVAGPDRSAFEASTGLRIEDTDGRGGFHPAPQRDRYIVVTAIEPITDRTRPVLGLDFRSDPIRDRAAAAAAALDAPRLSAPIALASSGDPGVFAIHSIAGKDGRVIGFVSSGLSLSGLVDRIRLPDHVRMQLSYDGRVLSGPRRLDTGAVKVVRAGGQEFQLRVDERTSTPLGGPALVALATIAVAALLVWATRHDRGVTMRLIAANRRSSRLASLAEQLAAAPRRAEVEDTVLAYAHTVVDADVTRIVPISEDAALARRPADETFVHELEVRPDGSAVAHAPLWAGASASTKLLEIEWSVPPLFTPGVETTLLTLGRLCAQTLVRAELAEREHELVVELQERLLQPLPDIAQLGAAAYYRPATAAVGMGGDWYQGAQRGDGLVVTIGDVTGHGVGAVASMAQLQYLAAALAVTGEPLDQVLPLLNEVLRSQRLHFASAQIFEVDPAEGRLSYGNAGHPFAMVRRPDGEVVQLTGSHGSLLGVGKAYPPLATIDFPPQSLLLAYTDGLIERRTGTISDQIDELADRFSRTEPQPDLTALLDELVDDSLADLLGVTTDDVAAILIRNEAS